MLYFSFQMACTNGYLFHTSYHWYFNGMCSLYSLHRPLCSSWRLCTLCRAHQELKYISYSSISSEVCDVLPSCLSLDQWNPSFGKKMH